jgi:DNA-binding PadR family transcriptional regulator
MVSGTKLSDLELTLLCLVAEGARYGTEIERLIAERGLREWLSVGSASFYYVLTRLEGQGLLTRAASSTPDQSVYQITDAGRGIVQTAIADLLCQPRSLSEGFSVGLANIGVLRPHQALRALVRHRDSLIHRLSSTEAHWAQRQGETAPGAASSYEAFYTHGIAVMRAELDWLNQYIESWRERYPSADRDETGEHSSATPPTERHRPTEDADRGKHIQKIRKPK